MRILVSMVVLIGPVSVCTGLGCPGTLRTLCPLARTVDNMSEVRPKKPYKKS